MGAPGPRLIPFGDQRTIFVEGPACPSRGRTHGCAPTFNSFILELNSGSEFMVPGFPRRILCPSRPRPHGGQIQGHLFFLVHADDALHFLVEEGPYRADP